MRERYPNAKITLVSSYKNKLLVEGSDWFSKILYWDQKVKFLPSLICEIRKQKPVLAILLHSKSPYDILCVSLSGCEYILKDSYNEKDLILKRWISSISNHEFKGHLIERKLNLVGELGCEKKDISMSIPVKIELDQEKSKDRIVVAFQLGASESLRRWPVYRFQELARLLLSSGMKCRIALIGSPKEINLANSFFAGMSRDECNYIENYVGTLNLKELVEHISRFDVLVTGDTGPLHIAVALKVPTISLFVTANPAHTGPLQDKELHTVIRVPPEERPLTSEFSDQPMFVITAQEVMSAISERSPTQL
ncbi:glycosyltransferase family 9 protein [Erwinia tracheiphila]|uniref:glycosyltransferase family 9 protein n=1 Tax=Erwinia tracheiphila TaxID=65700 RepID=UPI00033A6A3E|nr:glycosyltransferase family 9 protein [Erwinia tracheiphila]EOS94056.1 glycosyl transferase family protein [Erwinia tracheiphila PSU-1]UIA89445.1 glycosyltransferase family 9 protein [Erwinia tracheiphila]